MIADRRDLRQVIASSERDSAEKSLIADHQVIVIESSRRLIWTLRSP